MCREIEIDVDGGEDKELIIAAIRTSFEKENAKFLQEYSVDLNDPNGRRSALEAVKTKAMQNLEKLVREGDRATINIGCRTNMDELELSKMQVRKMFAESALHVDTRCVDVPVLEPMFLNNLIEKCRTEFKLKIEAFNQTVPESERIQPNIKGTEDASKLCGENGLDPFSLECVQFFVSRLNTAPSEAFRKRREVS